MVESPDEEEKSPDERPARSRRTSKKSRINFEMMGRLWGGLSIPEVECRGLREVWLPGGADIAADLWRRRVRAPANLDQAMGGASAPGPLAVVYELATSRVNGADASAARIREKAENTLREHDFELSERIYDLRGELAQAARGNWGGVAYAPLKA
jgi:hypothetical protein